MTLSTPTQLLSSLLSLPDSTLLHSLSQPPIHSALLNLLQLAYLSPSSDPSSRQLLFALFSHLSTLTALPQSVLSLDLLALFCAAFGERNKTKVEAIVGSLLSADQKLLHETQRDGPKLLTGQRIGVEGWEIPARVSLRLARSCGVISMVFGEREEVLRALVEWYDQIGTSQQQKDLEFKLEILETTYTLVKATYISPSASQTPTFPNFEPSSLWIDLERYFFVSVRIAERSLGADRNNEEMAVWFGNLVRNPSKQEVDWVEELRRMLEGSGSGKGKGKQTNSSTDPTTSATIQQVLDVLPHFPLPLLNSLIASPFYQITPSQSTSEQIISGVLEGKIDLEATAPVLPFVATPTPSSNVPTPVPTNRRNVFDDEKIQRDRLVLKSKRDKDRLTALPPSLDLSEALKAAIIERAEAPSSDEEDGEGDGEAFLDDEDETTGQTGRKGKTLGGEGAEHESDVEEEGKTGEVDVSGSATPQRDPLSNPIGPILSHLLEETYISDPTVFTRDSTTRKSKARIALREKTGLADEQIEGWRIMFERDPKKDKILAKHEFKGNKVGGAPAAVAEGSGGGGPREEGGSNSRGGGDRGRGRGGNRGRGDGGRAAHNRRQRGNDRKMAKVG